MHPLRHVLDNGLTVLLLPNHAAPVVALQAWVGVGSADERPGQEGIAHVFEHMLFKGTARRGVGQIAMEVEAAGGDINAWTSFDQTVYHLVLASRWFDTGLDILADAVQHSSFDPVELERERKVVLEEIKQGEDSPSRVLTQSMFQTAFTKHPYRAPVIGTADSVRGLSREKLLAFFKEWYVPNNITLVVVGDFDPDEALAKIEKAWGSAEKRKLDRPARGEPAQSQPRSIALVKDVRETHVQIAFHVPGIRSEDTGALDVASIILGQGDSSRLNLSVKRQKQLVTDVYAYTYTPRDPGLMVVGATLPGGDPDAAIRAMLGEVFRLAHEDVSPEELAKAQRIIESDTVYQKETVQGMARKLGFYETVAGGASYEAEYQKQVQSVTPARVREIAAKYLTTANMTIAVMVPENPAGTVDGAESAPTSQPKADTKARKADLERAVLTAAADEERAADERFAKVTVVPDKGEVIRRVLPNGTRILVKRDASVPIVAFRAVWVGGSRWEDERTAGVNHMIATLVTRGTSTRTGEELSREVEGMAGAIGGFSGRNSFGLRAEVLAKSWERGLELMADCVNDPAFPADEVEKEKRQVLDELAAQEDNLTTVVFRLFGETMYKKHPYRWDMLGTPASVAGFSKRSLSDYYARNYPASDMTIAIVGDVDPARAIEKATALFGGGAGGSKKVVKREPPKVPREDLWARPKGTIEVYKFLEKRQAHMVVGFPGTTIDDPDRFALEVLSTVLSGQGGRLFVELRDKKGLAYRVNAFSMEGIDPGYFAVYIACSPENLPAAMAGIREELRRVVEEPIPPGELERAKKYLVGTHEISLQRRSAQASTLAFHEAYGLGWDEYRRYAAGVLAVDPAAVQRVARKYLDWDYAVVATVKPEELTPGAKKRADGVKKLAPPPAPLKRVPAPTPAPKGVPAKPSGAKAPQRRRAKPPVRKAKPTPRPRKPKTRRK